MTKDSARQSPAILAVDMGTSSVRALLVDQELNILSRHSVEVALREPRQGWVEQDASAVADATFEAMRGAVAAKPESPGRIAGICFSSAVSSLLPLGPQLEPLAPALIWADTRAFREAGQLQASRADVLYRRTGCPIHASYWLPKLQWWREHEIETFSRACFWVGLKDYVLHRLTGKLLIDLSNAAATGLANPERACWDDLALSLARVEPSHLPGIAPTSHVIPRLEAPAAERLGLPIETPVVLGAGDGVLSNLGAGAVLPGQAATMIGTSGAARAGAGSRIVDRARRTWCYPLVDGYWIIGGAENSGGIVVQWLLDEIYGGRNLAGAEREAVLDQILFDASTAGPGAGGLIFLPYLLGERAPIWNEQARGAFLGLTLRHTRAQMARAVLEGTVYALYSVFEALEDQVGMIRDVRVSGGYVRSPLWLQIQADLFGRRLAIPSSYEGSALGAGILGHHALGHACLQDLAAKVQCDRFVEPNEANYQRYRSVVSLYKQAYDALVPVFSALSTLD